MLTASASQTLVEVVDTRPLLKVGIERGEPHAHLPAGEADEAGLGIEAVGGDDFGEEAQIVDWLGAV
jgi:hypothetical protein